MCSVSPSGRTPTSGGSGPVGALGRRRPSDAAKDRGPQDASIWAAHGSEGPTPDMPAVVGTVDAGDGSPAPEVESEVARTVVVEVVSSPVVDEVAYQDRDASSSGPASPSSLQPQVAAASASVGTDDNIMEEQEAVLGHPLLRALRDVSLNEAMGIVCWASIRHRTCSVERVVISMMSVGASCCGPPCSRGGQALRGQWCG
jgi:hypothetical protein